MAQLYIRTVDKVNTESKIDDAGCTKRGDVIVVVEDDHRFGPGELFSGEHVIVKVPGVPADQFSGLCEREPGDRKENPYLVERAFKFDLDTHQTQYGRPGSKELTRTETSALVIQKPATVNPDVIGGEGDVIGGPR